LGVTLPGRKVNRSPQSGAKVMNEWSCTTTNTNTNTTTTTTTTTTTITTTTTTTTTTNTPSYFTFTFTSYTLIKQKIYNILHPSRALQLLEFQQ